MGASAWEGALKLAAVIPAAGAGARLGGVAKALLRSGGETLLARIVRTAREVGLDDAVVVVGAPFGDAVADHARSLAARVVVNPDPSRGMASSIELGFAALGGEDAAWLWPVDHPNIAPATLRALIAALVAHPKGICSSGGSLAHRATVAQPRFGERGGHPPLIARALWPRLAACSASTGGARGVFAELAPGSIVAVPVDDPGVIRDVDTPADAEALS